MKARVKRFTRSGFFSISAALVSRVVEYILMGKEKGFWGAQDGYVYEP